MRVLHIVLNNFTHDSRVLRACETGLGFFGEVDVFALHAAGLPAKETQTGITVHRFRLWTRSWPKVVWIQLFKYVELFSRMIFDGLRLRPQVVHAHDLNALPMAFMIARMCRAKLIYDSHEYWADVEGYREFPHFLLSNILRAEKFLARRADRVVTVSQAIAEKLKADYGLKHVTVVRNMPRQWRVDRNRLLLRKSLHLDKDAIIFLYQGGIAMDRGVGLLFDAFRTVTVAGTWLVYLGDGPAVRELRQRTAAAAAPNVLFHAGVTPEDLPRYTCDANVGVLPQLPVSQNSVMALPNKLFEYVQGGLALIGADLPEISKVIRDSRIGLTFTPGQVCDLAVAIETLASDHMLRQKYREMALIHAETLCWEKENLELVSMYRGLVE